MVVIYSIVLDGLLRYPQLHCVVSMVWLWLYCVAACRRGPHGMGVPFAAAGLVSLFVRRRRLRQILLVCGSTPSPPLSLR